MTIASISLPSHSNGSMSRRLDNPASAEKSIQNTDSSTSSSTMANFEMKSAFDLATHAEL